MQVLKNLTSKHWCCGRMYSTETDNKALKEDMRREAGDPQEMTRDPLADGERGSQDDSPTLSPQRHTVTKTPTPIGPSA